MYKTCCVDGKLQLVNWKLVSCRQCASCMPNCLVSFGQYYILLGVLSVSAHQQQMKMLGSMWLLVSHSLAFISTSMFCEILCAGNMLRPSVGPGQGSCWGTRTSCDMVAYPVLGHVRRGIVPSALVCSCNQHGSSQNEGESALWTWRGWWQLWHFPEPWVKCLLVQESTIALTYNALILWGSLFCSEAET